MSTNIVIKTSDGSIEAPRDILKLSSFLENVSKYDGFDSVIHLCNIDTKTMTKVFEFFQHEKDSIDDDSIDDDSINDDSKKKTSNNNDIKHSELTEWDIKFCEVSFDHLFEISLAANLLNIPKLLHIVCTTMASFVKGLDPESIRKLFKLGKYDIPDSEDIY
jgi:hypothetical protein